MVEVVTEPSSTNLLERLRQPQELTPVRAACLELSLPSAPREGISGRLEVLYPRSLAEGIGPNVVVVYAPGSIADLCLLWDLRAAHGLPSGFPLAVPASEDAVGVIRGWWAHGASSRYGLSEVRCALVSFSVSSAELTALAEELGEPWTVAQPGELLRTAPEPFRPSTDVAVFTNGGARVAAWSPGDLSRFDLRHSLYKDLGLAVRLSPLDSELPPSRSLVGPVHGPTFRRGACEIIGAEAGSLVTMRWPTNWTVFEAVVRDRGLKARPSSAGAAAEALLHRLGSLEEIQMLCDPAVVRILNDLGRQSGMSWMRELAKTQSVQIDEEFLRKRAGSPREEDLHDIGLDEVKRMFDNSEAAATAWLDWAESRGVLVRGTRVRCRNCGRKSWRALPELAASMVCRGCGRSIARPFPHTPLNWRYRASEIVVQVVFHDALIHLLAMRWLASLFYRGFDKPEELYGVHPGVEFLNGKGLTIGEADVVLLFANGDLVLGECKRNAEGLNAGELDKLDALGRILSSPWTFVATSTSTNDCGPLWQQSVRTLPQQPRFALTGEHLYSMPWWTTNENALAWREPGSNAIRPWGEPFAARVVKMATSYLGRADPDLDITRSWKST